MFLVINTERKPFLIQTSVSAKVYCAVSADAEVRLVIATQVKERVINCHLFSTSNGTTLEC